MRIGTGYDAHRLAENRKLVLGGVLVPHERGLLGVSDADVLLHAVMDALLGAAALGDIGKHFPPSDKRYEGISSLLLLDRVSELLKQNGFEISNIDSIVTAQKPRLSPYIQQMRENIAAHCGIELSRVSVKATTTEGMGFEGEELGISAQAVCLLKEKERD